MRFKGILRFLCACFFPPDQADISEKKANDAYNTYLLSPGNTAAHSLEAAIVHYRESIRARPITDPKYASSRFLLANIHWEAYNARGALETHLKEAIVLYEETLDVWKDVNPKPEGYFELLQNLGKAHYDLFDTDTVQHTKKTLRKATQYYQLAFQHANDKNMASNCSEIDQILGSIIWKGCELEEHDIRLDYAIDHLSGAYKSHTSDIPFFNNSSCPHLVDIHSAVGYLTSIIDRSPKSPQIRDQSLLHLCQALLFRFNYKGRAAELCDLIRAEAVARSAIPLVSSKVELEFKKLLVLIQHRNDQEGVDENTGSSSTSATPTRPRFKIGLPNSVDTLAQASATTHTNPTTNTLSKKKHDSEPHVGSAALPFPNVTPPSPFVVQETSSVRQKVPPSQTRNSLPTPQWAADRSNQRHSGAAKMSQTFI